jgi:hypothetical protein
LRGSKWWAYHGQLNTSVRAIKGENMKAKLTLLLVTLFVFLPNADTLNTLKPSIYSLQLKTNGLFAISSLLPGTMISIKKLINSKDSYRISVGVSAEYLNTTQEMNNYKYKENNEDSLSISLHVSWLRYLYYNRNMYLYLGIGPFGKYSYYSLKQIDLIQTSNLYSIGIDAFPGIEWFIIEHLSLLLEYDLSINYQYTFYKTEIYGNSAQWPPEKTHKIRLEYNSVYIGLSIYF